MITIEQLSANPALSALTDEMRAAIAQMSANDEATVIGKKIGDIYNDLDKDIESSTGVKRNGDEKTYDYLKRAGSLLKSRADKAANLEVEMQNLVTERDSLKEQIKTGGGDAELSRKLTEAESKLLGVQKDYNDLKKSVGEMQSAHESKLHEFRVDAEISAYTSGLAFKKEIPEVAAKALLKDAIAAVKGMKSEFIDDGVGGKRLAYRDETDSIKRNAATNLSPYTTAELIAEHLKDVLDTDRQQLGGGAHPNNNQDKAKQGVIDLTGIKTQLEAHERISEAMQARGIGKGTAAYQDVVNKAWEDNKIAELPEK